MDIHKAESFKEFEEKFKLLFDNAADPIFILDNKGKFIQINKKVKEILGYREKDLIGKKFTEMNILTKKSKLIALKNFIKRMAGFEIKSYEIEIIKKNGDIVIGEINASAIKENGKTIGDMVICRDITEKRKTEEQIKESEKKYKILYESSNDAIMTLEPPSWKFTSGNPATVNMFNTKDEKEFTSLGPWELSPEKQPNGQLSSEKAKKMIEKAMKEGSNFFEWTHKRYKGEDFPATVLLSRVELKGRKFLQATVRDISKEKKAQKEIKESEEKYKAIVENATDWIFLLDTKLRYISLNKAVTNVLHSTASELIGKSVLGMFPKEIAANFARNNYEVIKTGKSKSTEEKMVVNGREFYISTSLNPLKNSKGKVIAIMGIVRDITEMKKAQEEIKESEEKYHALISNIPAIVMNVDQNGKIMFINYTLPGFTIEKTIGKTIYDFIPPEYHDKVKETIKQVFKTGKASIYETIGAGPKGEMKYYSTIVGPTEQEKKVVSVVLISSDITERKKAEEKIKTSEARYRSYIEATKQLGWTTDAKGLVTEDILTWRAYTGQSFEKIKNWGWVKAIHPDDAKHTAEVWKEAVKTKSIYEAEYRIRGKDGKYKWFFARGIPVFKEDGSIREWVGTCIDISERIKVEEEIKKARDELQSKVEELERFNRLAVGRELKMVELKNRIKELEEKSNKT